MKRINVIMTPNEITNVALQKMANKISKSLKANLTNTPENASLCTIFGNPVITKLSKERYHIDVFLENGPLRALYVRDAHGIRLEETHRRGKKMDECEEYFEVFFTKPDELVMCRNVLRIDLDIQDESVDWTSAASAAEHLLSNIGNGVEYAIDETQTPIVKIMPDGKYEITLTKRCALHLLALFANPGSNFKDVPRHSKGVQTTGIRTVELDGEMHDVIIRRVFGQYSFMFPTLEE